MQRQRSTAAALQAHGCLANAATQRCRLTGPLRGAVAPLGAAAPLLSKLPSSVARLDAAIGGFEPPESYVPPMPAAAAALPAHAAWEPGAAPWAVAPLCCAKERGTPLPAPRPACRSA
eukprot:621807-Prymnesium_polylepis.2